MQVEQQIGDGKKLQRNGKNGHKKGEKSSADYYITKWKHPKPLPLKRNLWKFYFSL